MKTAQDMMNLQLSLEFVAVDKDGQLVKEEYLENLSLEIGNSSEAAKRLRDLADAIEDLRAYGWLSQEIMDSSVGSGDLRSETIREYLDRLGLTADDGDETSSGPDILVSEN